MSSRALTSSFGRRVGRPLGRLGGTALNPLVMTILFGFACVAFYGLVVQDMALCVEAVFLGFIPYILWSAYRRTGTLDFFAPDVGFPLGYILYLFVGTINLPIETQFGLVLPWTQWLYYILGLVTYLAGTRLLPKPSFAVAAGGVRKVFWPRERFLSATLVLLAVGVAARSIYIARWGLPILHAEDEAARIVHSGGIIGVLSLCMEAAFECLLLYLLVKKPGKIIRGLVVACMLLILLNAVATTNRTALLRIAIAACVVIHYTARRFKFRGIVTLALFVGVFTSVLGTFRDVSDWGEAHIEKLEGQGFTSQTYWLMNGYEALRLPTETFEMTLEEVPLITPYSYGKTSFAAIAQILPGHRPGPSEIVKNTLRFEFEGFGAAATILAPMWMDGGWLGIAIGMSLFGVIARALHQRMLTSRSYTWVLVYGWFVQNAFKAIKDDVLPELGVLWMITLFIVVHFAAGYSSEKARPEQL
jgi:oligosaccharide repeat unit polymerase